MRILRSVLGLLAAVGTVASCQAPVSPVVAPPGAAPMSMTIDAAHLLDDLASKPSITWQDAGLSMPALQVRKQANASRYKTQALAGSVTRNLQLAAGASSSTPAYLHVDPYFPGPAPQAGDRLFVVTDSGTLYALNATTLAVTASRAGLGTFNKGAVLLSGDGKDVYALNTAGKLWILDAGTLATRSSQNMSGAGFVKSAPYIDYTTSTIGNGGHDDLYVVANDGTINKVFIDTATGASGAPTVWTAAAAYGGAVSVTSFPVVWNQHAYIGTSTGVFYDVTLTPTPTRRSWNLAAYTSATGTGRAITAPASFDTAFFPIASALFVPCGDRLVWIDPATGDVTPSLSLTVDKLSPTQSALSTYTPASTVTRTFTSTDYVSAKRVNSNPSRWGGSLGNVFNTGVQGTSVKYSTMGASGAPELWTANYGAGNVSRLNLTGTAIGSYGAASANEVDVDSAGYCWSSSGAMGGGNANRIFRFAPNGTRTVNVAVNNGLWPAADNAGNCWVSTYTRAPGLVKLDSTGAQVDSASSTIPSCFSVAVNQTNNTVWATSYGNNRLYRLAANGNVQGFTNVGNTPSYVAIDPATGNAWTANNGAGTLSVVSPTGTLLKTIPVPANVWAIKFDNVGNPWTCHLSPTSQVNELDKTTGNILSTYNMSAFGNCYEMTFDSMGNGWVATDGGIIELLALGNLTDLFASNYYNTPGDTDDSYGYVKFKVPVNNYTGYAPVAANLKLTANNTPTGTETFSVFSSAVTTPGGALWTGYPGTPNVDWNSRPAVDVPALATSTGLSVVKDVAYTWPVPNFGDQVNSADGTNAQYAYAFRSSGKKLGDVAHWYSNTSAGGTTARYPTLAITLANTAKLPTNGISCQAAVNYNNKIYVAACNAMWELDYSSPATFQSPSKTLYNLGQLGRSGSGPITAGGGKTYIYQTTNVLQTWDGRLVMAELNPANNQLNLANFTTGFAGGVDHLGYQVNVTPATTGIGQQLLFDFAGGSVYMTSANGYVIRANILQ